MRDFTVAHDGNAIALGVPSLLEKGPKHAWDGLHLLANIGGLIVTPLVVNPGNLHLDLWDTYVGVVEDRSAAEVITELLRRLETAATDEELRGRLLAWCLEISDTAQIQTSITKLPPKKAMTRVSRNIRKLLSRSWDGRIPQREIACETLAKFAGYFVGMGWIPQGFGISLIRALETLSRAPRKFVLAQRPHFGLEPYRDLLAECAANLEKMSPEELQKIFEQTEEGYDELLEQLQDRRPVDIPGTFPLQRARKTRAFLHPVLRFSLC